MKERKIADAQELLKQPYLDEYETAKVSKRSVSTLRNQRHLRKGFPYLKIGGSIRYKTTDIVAAMESRRVTFD